MLAEDARGDVGAAAGGEADKHFYGPIGIVGLRIGIADKAQRQGDNKRDIGHHAQ